MSKKYVIEVKTEYEDTTRGIMILGARDSNLYVDTLAVEDLEELNSDYVNENFGGLQDEAYQRGLDDAWEAARKIALMDTETSENVTGYFGLLRIMENLTPMQALEKLKAYEEKQKAADEIKVGDEVIYNGLIRCVVVAPETNKRYASLFDCNGNHYSADHQVCMKTGRHFDIEKILEAMRC